MEMETNLETKDKYKYIVYQTINLVNNKIYIGVHKTVDPTVFDGYIGCGVKVSVPSSYMHPTTPFHYAVKKYGVKNFKRTVLKIFDNLQDAFDLERFLVDPEFLKRPDTYNSCLGGGNGFRVNYVHQFDLDGNWLKTWTNILEASEFYNVSHSAIMNAIKFNGSSCGYFWSYSDKINVTDFTVSSSKRCYMYNGDTLRFEKDFCNNAEAAKYLGVTVPSISGAIHIKYKCKNHYFSNTLYDEYPKMAGTLHLKNSHICVYTLEGVFVKEFVGYTEICKFLNCTPNVISRAIKANRPYKKYQISLIKTDKLDPIQDCTSYKKRVGRYSKTGELLEVFESATEARKKYSTSVTRCLKGQQQFCHGFVFKYMS